MSGPGRKSMLMASVMMAGAAYLSYASGLLGSILAARTLGPRDYGIYAYIIWLAGVAVSIVNHGLPVSAIKFISESLGAGKEALAGQFHAWLRRAHGWSMCLLGGVILAVLWWRHPAGWDGHVLVFAAVVMVGTFSKGAYLFRTSVSKGHGIFSVEARTVALLSLINVVALLLAWIVGVSLMGMLAIYAGVSVGYWVSARYLMARERICLRNEPLPAEARARLVHHLGWTVVLTAIGVFNEGSVNMYALNEFVGSAEVGYYTIAAGLTKAGMDLLTVGLSSVLMTSMSHAAGKEGVAGLTRVFHGAVKNFHFFGLMLVGLGCLAADWAVHLLYGNRYESAILIMKVMFVLGGLTLSEGVFASLLSVLDRQRDRVFINAASLLITVPVSFLLIRHHGLMGAVWAYAVNRVLVFGIAVISSSRMAGVSAPWSAMARLTVAMLLALLLPLGLVQLWPGLVSGVIACAAFGLSFIALASRSGVWSASELAAVMQLVNRIPLLSRLLVRILPAHPEAPHG